MGFLSVLAIFAAVTMVSYGVMPRAELAKAAQPSMGTVLESVVGAWGSDFIAIGLVISVQGAYLAWTLINAEVLYMPAETQRDAAIPGPTATRMRPRSPPRSPPRMSIQLLLLVVLFVDNALDFMLKLDTALSLIPYLLAAGYALKLTITRETYAPEDDRERAAQPGRSPHSRSAYAVLLLYSAGLEYLILACIVYAPGTLLYLAARREQGGRVFKPAEAVACAVLVAAAAVGRRC